MDLSLNPTETRVLGALIEKELATPDYYPLSLAALTNACNQKTSRDPVTSLSEAEVHAAVDSLVGLSLARERSPAGSRVPKYSHRLDAELGLSFGFDRDQRAVLCVLMLRGPQTPGELRTRTERLRGEHRDDVDAVLAGLRVHERGPWVRELAREPGRREPRWAHLIGDAEVGAGPDVGIPDVPPAPERAPVSASPDGHDDRVTRLEREIERLDAEILALQSRMGRIAGDEPDT